MIDVEQEQTDAVVRPRLMDRIRDERGIERSRRPREVAQYRLGRGDRSGRWPAAGKQKGRQDGKDEAAQAARRLAARSFEDRQPGAPQLARDV